MTLQNIIGQLGQPHILVIGDLILDGYIWGRATRISPEAPIQILNAQTKEFRLGGSANVAHNLFTLGAKVDCLGVAGADNHGQILKDRLRETGISPKYIISDRTRTTPLKTRLIAQNQQILRLDEEKAQPLSGQAEQKLMGHLKNSLRTSDLVVVSDYLKGTLTEKLLHSIISQCRAHHKKLIIGPKGQNYHKYAGATAITPNRSEAETASRIEIKDNDSLKQSARRLIKSLRLDFIVITLGEKGIYLLTRQGEEIYDHAKPLSVYDVTGAGDTVLAALSLGIAASLDYQSAIHLANLAAGVVVGKVGTATVSRDEIIKHDYQFNQTTRPERKIKSLPELLETLRSMSHKKVVFTNGCFDILHPGHIKTLTYARAQGDILVVGLNSDKSVRALKGKTRPLFPQHLRARTLASLECVDYVIIFNEPTPLNLIRRLRPNVLVKGADWKGQEVVGEKIVKSSGGAVRFSPLEPGISTTGIINQTVREKIRIFPNKKLDKSL